MSEQEKQCHRDAKGHRQRGRKNDAASNPRQSSFKPTDQQARFSPSRLYYRGLKNRDSPHPSFNQFSFPGLESLCIIFILSKSESTFTKPWRPGKAASLGRLKIYLLPVVKTKLARGVAW